MHIVEAGGRHFLLHLLCEDTRAELAHFIRCRSSTRFTHAGESRLHDKVTNIDLLKDAGGFLHFDYPI